MDLALSEDQLLIQETARRLSEAEIKPRAAQADRDEQFPLEQVRMLARAGFMAMLVPAEYGGAEAGAVSYSLAMTEVARCCASTAVTMAVTNMVADAVSAFGSDKQKETYLPRIASGEITACSFALSEPGAGSDAGALTATAVRSGDQYILQGTKCWITSGDQAGLILVLAKTDAHAGTKGISAFLVDRGTPGVVVGAKEEKLGLRASSTVTLMLEDVALDASARLGPEGAGFKIAMRGLDGGRIGIGSQAVGIALAALEAARTYVLDRQQFGRPLADFQATQWKLADMATEIDAARLLVLRAASMKDAGKVFTREASMGKLFASEMANRVTAHALQMHGGYGYTRAFPAERHLRDARVTTIYEGTSEIQRLVIARSLLRG